MGIHKESSAANVYMKRHKVFSLAEAQRTQGHLFSAGVTSVANIGDSRLKPLLRIAVILSAFFAAKTNP
jgi:hypothetical protein